MIPELLAPAGNLEKAKFAFAYGADAVYAGVPQFALRTKENKFNTADIKAIIEYAHSLGKKVYVTTNIYPHNNKIEPFLKAMEELVKLKPDAFIISDPGMVYLVRENWPEVTIHLSTQANTLNWASAQFWKKIGVNRIILGRELSVKEIKTIAEKNPELECEVFIHGAMCMAYSGRCLISNFLTGRDANQGSCAQSCRWSYKLFKEENGQIKALQENKNYVAPTGDFFVEEQLRPEEYLPIEEDQNGTYLFNSRDLCGLDFIKDLTDAKVASLKIEGRNKSTYYVAITTKVYREVIDALKNRTKIDREKLLLELQSSGNRGFIPGFLAGPLGPNAQRYNSNEILSTHTFIGTLQSTKQIQEENGKTAWVVSFEAKNRVDVGEKIEIVTPEKTIIHKITEMKNEDDEPIEVIHPGKGIFKIKIDESPNSEFALARIKGGQKRK